ncbi:Or42a [Drosophila busckii]|uniref:Or42a n=2 Tax=Drosophila busckii TaxID=30019 RepID=A0A0M4EAL7_DROBS|nr:Or42a [Drosophila busckii]
MVLRKIFPSMYSQSDEVPARSRNATLYLLRCVFLMGIRRPPQHYLLAYCLWSLALNLSSTFYQPLSILTAYIIHISEFTPGEFLTSLQVAFNAWSCSTKVIIVWLLVRRFDAANDILDELDARLSTPGEYAKVHREVARSNGIFFVFMTVYMAYATSTFLAAVAIGVPMYQNYYPFLDWRASKWEYWL